MFKNVSSQKLIVFAFDSTTNLPKSGDAANITAYVGKDFGAATVLGDTSATEIDATNAKGYYLFDLTQAETNADTLHFTAKSSTSNIVVIGAPAVVFTVPANFTSTVIDSNGRLDVIKIAGTSQTARDLGASVLLSPGTGTGQISLTSGAVTVGTNGDKTGYSLSVTPPTAAAIATAVWQDTTAGDFTVASSIGKSLYTSGAVPGAAGGLFIAGTNAATTITTSLTTTFTGNLTGSVGSCTGNVGGNVTGSVGSVAGNVTGSIGSLASQAKTDVTAAVWDATMSAHVTSLTTGAALNAAGSAGDPWATALPGAYGAGTAGHIIGTALPDLAPGASGGLLKAGSNSGTTTFAALTVSGATTLTGNVSMAAGLNITQSSSNTSALVVTGNGTGHGAAFSSGSGATGDGINIASLATNGNGIASSGHGGGDGLALTGGATGYGFHSTGGASSTAGARFDGGGTNSNAIYCVGVGTGDGISALGGSSGGRGAHFIGGATSGSGMRIEAQSGNSNAVECVKAGSGVALSAPTTDMVLAKTTNITGFNDIAATAIVSDGVAFLGARIDAAITSRMATFTLPTNFSALAITVGGAVTAGTVSDKTGYSLSTSGIDALYTRQLTESYAADGTAPTVAQALFLIQQSLHEFSISGTTRTVKRLDGSTSAATFTLDSSSAPTSTTRAS